MTSAWEELGLPFLRLRGRDLPAAEQMHAASEKSDLPIEPVARPYLQQTDNSLIDPALPMKEPISPERVPEPGYRPNFSQLTPEQRWIYWNWLRQRNAPPHVGYAVLYLQMLEAALFDVHALDALAEMRWLHDISTALSIREFVTYDAAIGAWLHQQPDLFRWSIEQGSLGAWGLGVLLWLQHTLDVPLTAKQAINIARLCGHTWSKWARQHLDDVEIAIERELAAHGNVFLREQASALGNVRHRAEFRLANGGIRFFVPANDLLTTDSFRRGLRDLLQHSERAAQLGGRFTQRNAPATQNSTAWVDRGWYLALEFGESSSEQLERVVTIARRHAGYVKLLDENREIVHRALYRKRDLSKFWSLFERVRSWKSTRVYINGNPVNVDYLWPGSPELQ